MTIVAGWIRKIRDAEELVLASDSRLSGDGTTFDACPKILTLPRTDCAIAFAGYTGHAFPMMLQLDLAISAYEPARRGALDIASLRKHAIKVFGTMANEIRTSAKISSKQDESPEAIFLFGGYSWVKKAFEMWSLSYEKREKSFVARPAQWIGFHPQANKFVFSSAVSPKGLAAKTKIVLLGDQAPNARRRLIDLMDSRFPRGATSFIGLDWEPFEVIRDMLRDPNHSETIGGAPQVVKICQYFQTAPLAVFWPNKSSGNVVLQGRPCLGYERIDRWILDPDTLSSSSPHFSEEEVEPGLPAEI